MILFKQFIKAVQMTIKVRKTLKLKKEATFNLLLPEHLALRVD